MAFSMNVNSKPESRFRIPKNENQVLGKRTQVCNPYSWEA